VCLEDLSLRHFVGPSESGLHGLDVALVAVVVGIDDGVGVGVFGPELDGASALGPQQRRVQGSAITM
jgi:hypothetical protein